MKRYLWTYNTIELLHGGDNFDNHYASFSKKMKKDVNAL